jgi:hypothetical protein
VFLETGEDKFDALRQAMEVSNFIANVEAVLTQSGKARDQFLIAIKPNIMTAALRENPSPVYTDPQLVEYVVDQLRARGFQQIAVVEARNVYDYSYQGRSVPAVAEMVGYSSNGYRIEDLSEQKEPFDYGGVLGEHVVGRTWRDADYRISFAKNKTHWQCFYTGCLKNIYGCLPEWQAPRVLPVLHSNPGRLSGTFRLFGCLGEWRWLQWPRSGCQAQSYPYDLCQREHFRPGLGDGRENGCRSQSELRDSRRHAFVGET